MTKIRKRTIILIGLIIYVIGGVIPQLVSSVEIILLLRLLLGAGVGLLMPLSMSLINDYYTGKERIGWRIPFNVYFLGLGIFILIFFFLPKGEVQEPLDHEPKTKIPLSVYGYSLAMGGIMLAYYAIATNMALYLEQNNLGGAGTAGTVVAFTTVGGMTTSILLVRLETALDRFIIPVMLFGMGLGFLTLTFTNSVILVIISVCFVGFAQGSLFPIIVIKALDKVKPTQADRAVAMTSSFTFLGQFLSPVVLDTAGKIAGTTAIRFQYGTLAIVIMIIVLITTWVTIRSRHSSVA